MIQVKTRGGVFGPGGYGGGIFDGSEGGFGGLGSAERADGVRRLCGMGAFPAPSAYPDGYPSPEYVTQPGETGSSIARLITGNPNRYTELVAANPSTKAPAPIGMRFNPGARLRLPASWVKQGGAPALPPPGSAGSGLPSGVAADDWMSAVQGFQYIANDILQELGYSTVNFQGTLDGATCGAADFIAKQIGAGARPGSGQAFRDALFQPIGPSNFGTILTGLCNAQKPWATPNKGGPATSPPPPPPPPVDESFCGFEFGDQHPQIAKLQTELNLALEDEGFEQIPVTGKYDAKTCGAVFALGGSFKPRVSAECPAGWVIPLDCPDKVMPKKIGEKSKTSVAWMLGGLLLAAAGSAAYAFKRK